MSLTERLEAIEAQRKADRVNWEREQERARLLRIEKARLEFQKSKTIADTSGVTKLLIEGGQSLQKRYNTTLMQSTFGVQGEETTEQKMLNAKPGYRLLLRWDEHPYGGPSGYCYTGVVCDGEKDTLTIMAREEITLSRDRWERGKELEEEVLRAIAIPAAHIPPSWTDHA